MRSIFLLFFCVICILPFARSQNIGVGTTNPTEKLDVNGNLNINGNLKIRGNAGQSGQVLSIDGSGQQVWARLSGYTRRKEFKVSTTWTVPAGVTEIAIEALGAGGGGAKGGGGGGGGYVLCALKVSPGQIVNMMIGLKGVGSLTESGSGTDGATTFVDIGPSGFLGSSGGSRAGSTIVGQGGSYEVFADSAIFIYGARGGSGKLSEESYSQRTSNEYVTVRKYGDGGINMYNPNVFQRGTHFTFNSVSFLNIGLIYGGLAGNFYLPEGTGGAGGNTPDGQWGYDGGFGMVVISW